MRSFGIPSNPVNICSAMFLTSTSALQSCPVFAPSAGCATFLLLACLLHDCSNMETSPTGSQWSFTDDTTAASLGAERPSTFAVHYAGLQQQQQLTDSAVMRTQSVQFATASCTRYATCRSIAAMSSEFHVRRDVHHTSGCVGGDKGFENRVLLSLCYLTEAVVDLKHMLVSCLA